MLVQGPLLFGSVPLGPCSQGVWYRVGGEWVQVLLGQRWAPRRGCNEKQGADSSVQDRVWLGAWSRRGWVTKQCRAEEGAEEGQQGRGPQPRWGPTVGVHVEGWGEEARELVPGVPEVPGTVASRRSFPIPSPATQPSPPTHYCGGWCGGSVSASGSLMSVTFVMVVISSPAPARGRVKGPKRSLGPTCSECCR